MNESNQLKIERIQLGMNFAYAPNQALVDNINAYLTDVYLFGAYDSEVDFETRVNDIQNESNREALESSLLEMSWSGGDEEIAHGLYALCGDIEVSGALHGWKRTLITDAMRISLAVCTHFAPDGLVVDLGCNSGYLLNWLCGITNRSGIGIDSSAAAIELANTLKPHENVEYLATTWRGAHCTEQASVIICSDTQKLNAEFLDWVDQVLGENGYFLHIDEDLPDFKMLKNAGFGCQHCEITGGYKHDGFTCRFASFISRNPSLRFSPPFRVWDNYFKDWCNSNRVPHHQKSLSQFLAQIA
jgi:hypothetical protein